MTTVTNVTTDFVTARDAGRRKISPEQRRAERLRDQRRAKQYGLTRVGQESGDASLYLVAEVGDALTVYPVYVATRTANIPVAPGSFVRDMVRIGALVVFQGDETDTVLIHQPTLESLTTQVRRLLTDLQRKKLPPDAWQPGMVQVDEVMVVGQVRFHAATGYWELKRDVPDATRAPEQDAEQRAAFGPRLADMDLASFDPASDPIPYGQWAVSVRDDALADEHNGLVAQFKALEEEQHRIEKQIEAVNELMERLADRLVALEAPYTDE